MRAQRQYEQVGQSAEKDRLTCDGVRLLLAASLVGGLLPLRRHCLDGRLGGCESGALRCVSNGSAQARMENE